MLTNYMNELENLIKSTRQSINFKKKFISAKTLNKYNDDFIKIIFDIRKKNSLFLVMVIRNNHLLMNKRKKLYVYYLCKRKKNL